MKILIYAILSHASCTGASVAYVSGVSFLATLPWGLPSLAAAFYLIYVFPQWLHWSARLVSAGLMCLVVARRLADLALPRAQALMVFIPLACALLQGGCMPCSCPAPPGRCWH